MSDSNSPGDKSRSARHKKRVVQSGLRKLKNKPGWDVEAFRQRQGAQAGTQGLRDLEQKMRGHQVYDDSAICEPCKKQRQRTGDKTALCEQHLAAAMGLDD